MFAICLLAIAASATVIPKDVPLGDGLGAPELAVLGLWPADSMTLLSALSTLFLESLLAFFLFLLPLLLLLLLPSRPMETC